MEWPKRVVLGGTNQYTIPAPPASMKASIYVVKVGDLTIDDLPNKKLKRTPASSDQSSQEQRPEKTDDEIDQMEAELKALQAEVADISQEIRAYEHENLLMKLDSGKAREKIFLSWNILSSIEAKNHSLMKQRDILRQNYCQGCPRDWQAFMGKNRSTYPDVPNVGSGLNNFGSTYGNMNHAMMYTFNRDRF